MLKTYFTTDTYHTNRYITQTLNILYIFYIRVFQRRDIKYYLCNKKIQSKMKISTYLMK